jgi:hypothetical protein
MYCNVMNGTVTKVDWVLDAINAYSQVPKSNDTLLSADLQYLVVLCVEASPQSLHGNVWYHAAHHTK